MAFYIAKEDNTIQTYLQLLAKYLHKSFFATSISISFNCH
jgi:hypothetical protein